MARLVVRLSDSDVRHFHLNRPEVLIGRDADACQIVLRSNGVSRRHARVTRDGTVYRVEDLDSRNGTTVNLAPLTRPAVLADKDVIRICEYNLRFEADATAEVPSLGGLGRLVGPADPPPLPLAVVARAPAGDSPALDPLAPDHLRAAVEVGLIACRLSLRPDELLPKADQFLGRLFPTVRRLVLLRRDPAAGGWVPDVTFVRPGPAADHAPDPDVVAEAVATRAGLLCGVRRDGPGEATVGPEPAGAVLCAPGGAARAETETAFWLEAGAHPAEVGETGLRLFVWTAHLVGLALESARASEEAVERALREGDNQAAQKIQQSFLPRTPPVLADYTFFNCYRPALMVGGDYFDWVPLPDGRIAVVLADVAGKGIAAALLMSRLSAEVRACVATYPDGIEQAVARLNDQLASVVGDRFVTGVVCVLDPATHRVKVVCAGHEPPRRVRWPGTTVEEFVPRDRIGPPLGMFPGVAYEADELALDPGDSLLLFTDGVTDAVGPGGAAFGLDGVAAAVAADPDGGEAGLSAQGVGVRVARGVARHLGPRLQVDDIAIVCFGRDHEEVIAMRAGTENRSRLGPAG